MVSRTSCLEGSDVISVTRYLPKAYAQPTPSDLQRFERADAPQKQRGVETEQIIEAEWRPVSGSGHPAVNAYKTHSTAFITDESTLTGQDSPVQAAARYREMSPQPQAQRGTLIDIQA